jgi:acyl-coenzyme A thioesterase PaaI-like protein
VQSPSIPFRLSAAQRQAKLLEFNDRREILWFGFQGSLHEPGTSVIRLTRLDAGLQGGGGTNAINGGVISAGFDAAFVLAGFSHYDTDVVVTLELSVKFLSLAVATESLAFRAHVVRSSRNFCFAEGFLADDVDPATPHLAIATAMVAPAR